MSEPAYRSQVRIEPIGGPMRRATIPGSDEPVLFGVHDEIAEHYGAKVVDYAQDSIMLRVFGSSEKLDALIELLRPFELVELVRSGKLLMARGESTT